MSERTLIVIAGPTASGKTAAAIQVAKALNTEIISADSRQFYKEMQIGTAAPTPQELLEVRHHFVHNISIKDDYDVATYEKDVLLCLERLFLDHDVVVMTGGSGMFIDAVCNGIDAMPDIEPSVRNQVSTLFTEGGLVALQEAVKNLDPEYWSIVDQQNPRRLQRALEVCYQTGEPFSSFHSHQKAERNFTIRRYALLWERQQLYNRINLRVEHMLSEGLVDEARSLYPFRRYNALNTVGYKELFSYFDGQCSLCEAVEQIKLNTRHYAKRQMTWFKKNPDYQWLSPNELISIFL